MLNRFIIRLEHQGGKPANCKVHRHTNRKTNKENYGNTKGKRHLESLGRSISPGGAKVLHIYKKPREVTGSGVPSGRASLASGLEVQMDSEEVRLP